jgi:hypothetical protein
MTLRPSTKACSLPHHGRNYRCRRPPARKKDRQKTGSFHPAPSPGHQPRLLPPGNQRPRMWDESAAGRAGAGFVSLDSRCRNPVEAGALNGATPTAVTWADASSLPAGCKRASIGPTCWTAGTCKECPGREDGASTTVRFRPGILAGACSGRLVEVRVSALVSAAKNGHAPGQVASRESRLVRSTLRRVTVTVTRCMTTGRLSADPGSTPDLCACQRRQARRWSAQ